MNQHIFGVALQRIISANMHPSPTLLRIIYGCAVTEYPFRGLQARKRFLLKRYKDKYVCLARRLQRDDGSIVLILVLDDVYHEYPGTI